MSFTKYTYYLNKQIAALAKIVAQTTLFWDFNNGEFLQGRSSRNFRKSLPSVIFFVEEKNHFKSFVIERISYMT